MGLGIKNYNIFFKKPNIFFFLKKGCVHLVCNSLDIISKYCYKILI
jgi:hypothetical protein